MILQIIINNNDNSAAATAAPFRIRTGVRRYSVYISVVAASGYVSGYASLMHRVGIGNEPGMHRGKHQVTTLSVKLDKVSLLAHAHNPPSEMCPCTPQL